MKRYFELKQEHVALLRRANVVRYATGSVGLDGKRPFGNSDVERDICEILGWPVGEDGCTEEQIKQAEAIHVELKDALSVVLVTADFILGDYETDRYMDDWRRVLRPSIFDL